MSADRSTIGPMPRATSAAAASSPSSLPSTDASAVRRPCASARPTTNSTVGPGMAMTTRASPQNARSLSPETMTVRLRPALAVPPRHYCPGRVGQDGSMPWAAPRHDRDAGGSAEVLAAKAELRQEVWAAMRTAKVTRFPGAAGRIPNFTGAEAAAERLRGLPSWEAAGTVKANPDSAQWPVRQRALEDGKT